MAVDTTPFRAEPHRWGAVAVLLLVVAGIALWRWLAGGQAAPRRKPVPEVVQLKLIQPPPPPPPAPPPPDKPKPIEPPRVLPPPMRTAAPPDDKPPAPTEAKSAPRPDAAPALDARGESGQDAFGLGGKPGGGDYIGGGGGGAGGTGGSGYGWYAALIQGHVRGQLQRRRNLLGARYRIGVEVWLDAEGRAQRVELVESTGKAAIDDEIRAALLGMPPLPQAPPPNLPQPVQLQVASS